MKKCAKCKNDKPLDNFVNRYTRYYDGKDTWCKDCKRNALRLSKYGISSEQYNEILIKQDNRCAICRKHESELKNKNTNTKFYALVIDHCHKTNKIRGLLCHNCNRGLGLLSDDLEVLKNAVTYYEENI